MSRRQLKLDYIRPRMSERGNDCCWLYHEVFKVAVDFQLLGSSEKHLRRLHLLV